MAVHQKEQQQRSVMRRSFFLLLVLMAVSVCVIYAHFLSGEYRYIFHNNNNDTANQYFPSIMSTIYKIKQGDRSFWDATMGYGLDITNSTSWVFDLFNVPVYAAGLIGGVNAALQALVFMQILKSFLTGGFTWLLLKELGFRGYSMTVAAYAAAFCGYMMAWGEHYFFASGTALFVILIWRIEWCLNHKKGYWGLALLVGVCLAFSLYVSIMIAIGCLIYLIFRLFSFREREGARQAGRMFGKMIAAVTGGAFLSAGLSLPAFWQLTHVTGRLAQGESTGEKIRKSFIEWFQVPQMRDRFLRFFSNNLNGTQDFYQGGGLYIEAIQISFSCFWILFLAMFFTEKMIYGRRKKQSAILLAGFLASVAFPLTGLIFNLFENQTTRYAFVYIPFAAYVIAWALTNIRDLHLPSLTAGWIMSIISVLAIRRFHGILNRHHLNLYVHILYAAFLAVMLAFTIANEDLREGFRRFVSAHGTRSQDSGPAVSSDEAADGPEKQKFVRMSETGGKRQERMYRAGYSLVCLLVVMSTAADAWYTLNYQTPWTDAEVSAAAGEDIPTERLLKSIPEKTDDYFRVEKMYDDFSVWNDALIQNYSGLSYYNTTYNKYVVRFIQTFWPETEYVKDLGTKYVVYRNDGLNLRMANLLGVRYILCSRETETDVPGLQKIADTEEGFSLYRTSEDSGFGTLYNRGISEDRLDGMDTDQRQRILEKGIVLSSEDMRETGLRKLEEKEFSAEEEDGAYEPYLGRKLPAEMQDNEVVESDSDSSAVRDQVRIAKSENDGRYEASVFTGEAKMLLLPVPYDSGWTAEIDGKQTKIYCADLGFQAVAVPAGTHQIRFSYETPGLKIGLAISFCSFVIWIVSRLMCAKRGAHGRHEGPARLRSQ